MAAPKGNQFWKLRSKHGRDKLFATPELLWEAACEYFQWCDDNPWAVIKTKKKGNKKETESTPTQRPYTLRGLMVYCDASEAFWRKFKKSNHEGFLSVIERIESIIETQQLEGATVGAFNPNIIARQLGLVDKSEVNNTGSVRADVKVTVVNSPIALATNEEEIED
nr:MAG TPA: Terminase small subunit [Caudoviricetes sp.]